MRRGFFPKAEFVAEKQISAHPKCGACQLYRHCNSPKMEVSGKGKKRILIVGEAPSKADDKAGQHFSGESGEYLSDVLRSLGVNMRRDCWLTYGVICNTGESTPKERHKQIGYCRPNLKNTIESLKPVLIIVFGDALKSIVPLIWKANDNKHDIKNWRGFKIPSQVINAWVCPTYSPSYIKWIDSKREGGERTEDPKVVKLKFRQDLKAALRKTRHPHKETIDYESQVEIIHRSRDVGKAVDELIESGKDVAFDYECDQLKPGENAHILSCAFSNGDRTIAFPWTLKTRKHAKRLLRNKHVGKIAAKLSFEEWWTLREFGVGVRNWKYDVVLGAHWLDHRHDIAGVKFQSLACLGVRNYTDAVEKFIKSKKGKVKNTLRTEVSPDKLLLYNGLDALYEYHIAQKQMKEGGIIHE